jgi:hypothetical protein
MSDDPIVIRITQNGKTAKYIDYLQNELLSQQSSTTDSSGFMLVASGRAATKAVIVAETLKSNVPGLQSTAGVSEQIKDDSFESILTIHIKRC